MALTPGYPTDMKPKGLAKTLLGTSALTAVIVSFAPSSALAASDTWDNGGGDNLWQTGTNWVTNAFPGTAGAVFTSTDDATFSTTGAGGTIDLGGTINIRSLIFGVSGGDAASFAIADATDTLNFTSAGGITINSGVTTAQTIGASGTTINLSNIAAAATTFTNNGTGLLTIAGNIAANVASGNGVLTVAGTGNTTITGTITKPGAGENALKKIGSGTLTLTNGSVWSGTGAVQTAFSGPFTVQEGTLLLNGGTHSVTGEAVIGGVVTHGGAGQNAKIQVDAGSLAISSWLSIGRGNGVGGVSSDLVLNNAATVTAANLSAGFNAGNALNQPKGTVVLNGTSSLSVNSGGAFQFSESPGANFTMTLNGTSSVTINGSGSATNRYIGNTGATGAVTLNSGTTFTNTGGIFNVGYQSGVGTLNINGGTFTSGGELRVSATNVNSATAGTGTVNMTGGTATVASLTLSRGNDNTFLGTGTFNLSGGSFTSTGATTVGSRSGTAAINMTGGTFTTGSLSIASSNAAADKAVGTVTVGAGSTLTSINDAIVGLGGTGASGASGKLIINGGTVNVGTTAEKWLKVSAFDTVAGQIDINSGTLNLNSGTDIRFNTNGSTGTSVINQNGGNVVSYVDNGITLGGATVLDFNQAGSTGNNTYNLNGGTLAISQVTSSVNNGTRTFNFNGGTLKVASNSNAVNFFNLGTGGTTRANVRNGGAIIDTNNVSVTIAQALEHSNIGGDNAIDGGLTKNGGGNLTLTNAANTYTGNTLVNDGGLATDATGKLGLGNVTLANSGILTLGNSNSIADTATLFFGANTFITLSDGINETVFGVVQTEDSQSIGAGTYTAAQLNAFFGVVDVFNEENTGTLTVVPEPSAALLGGLGVLGLLRRRRKA